MPKIALKEHLGEVVEVVLLDHTWGGDKGIFSCSVWGRLIKVDNIQIVLRVWETSECVEANAEYANIVRSAITAVHRLRRVK